MTRKLLNPKVDFVFKEIFGSEENKSVLISFLNAILNPQKEIVSVDLKNTNVEYMKDKFSGLCVKATTSNNKTINIEIQLEDENDITQKTLYYWSKMFNQDDYYELNKTICINISNFKFLANDRFHNIYRFKEKETNKELTDMCEIHFIEIPKLRQFKSDDKADMLELWVEFLRNPESEFIRKEELKNNELKKAKDKLYKLSQSKE